jgi:hypothetical protein
MGMWKYRKNIKDQEAKSYLIFGFVLIGYKTTIPFWEIMKIMLRILTLIFYELIVNQLLISQFLTGTVLLIYILVLWKIKPFKKELNEYNYIDCFNHLVLLICIY